MAARIEDWLAATGAETLHGRRASSAGRLEVDGRTLHGRDLVIAAGARPMTLGIEGEELLTTSDEFLELDELPPRIVFIGGGYISFEFAWLARMAGAEVTILHRSARASSRASTSMLARGARRALPHAGHPWSSPDAPVTGCAARPMPSSSNRRR